MSKHFLSTNTKQWEVTNVKRLAVLLARLKVPIVHFMPVDHFSVIIKHHLLPAIVVLTNVMFLAALLVRLKVPIVQIMSVDHLTVIIEQHSFPAIVVPSIENQPLRTKKLIFFIHITIL